VFDVAIIGSGPAAIAALEALPASKRIAMITGVAPFRAERAQLHPKIQAVALARGEAAGVAEPIPNMSDRAKPLFSTAAIGGLANYWGQQFSRCLTSEPWPHELFSGHADYLNECLAVERLFSISGGQALGLGVEGCGFRFTAPRLLLGARDNPTAGLDAMRGVYQALEKKKAVNSFATRAHSFKNAGASWIVALDDGQSVAARQILLAAGVIGGAHLLLRSFPDLVKVRFRDHTPWMLYTVGLRRLISACPRPVPGHFNAVAFEKTENDRCVTFGSIYDMRHAEFNLLLASVLGRSFRALRDWRAPPGASFVNPVQVWTPLTYNVVEIDARTKIAACAPSGSKSFEADPQLDATIEVLSALGGRVIKTSRTRPGSGFHYHGLEIMANNANYAPAAGLLEERTASGVRFVDASMLQKIGCRPPTLTAMASGRRAVQVLC
jgi:hypothetical protein